MVRLDRLAPNNLEALHMPRVGSQTEFAWTAKVRDA